MRVRRPSADVNSPAAQEPGLLLDSFVSSLIRERIARDPSSLDQPRLERFQAVVLLADLSGFSALTQEFAKRGPRGAEDLKDHLNFFCGHLVDLVDAHGGQILKFPGDAALALWRVDDSLDDASALRLAAQCALAARQTFRDTPAPNRTHLQLRAGIGAGEVWTANLGGVNGRWELLVAGEPIAQAAHAMSIASTDEVGVPAPVWGRISPYARRGRQTNEIVCVEAVTEPLRPVPLAHTALTQGAEELVRAYIPRSVQTRLDAGQTDWLAEFRRVTVLFIELGILDYDTEGALAQAQRAVVAVQNAVYRYGGSINQLLADDKGTVIACGWGLALHAHGDNEVRATRAALDLLRELGEAGCDGSFGVATGQVFTGLRGNRHRCEFAMIGETVNVACRLMQASDRGVFCDLATFEAASKRIEFEALPPIAMKGHQSAAEVFRPVLVPTGDPSEIVGRLEERGVLRERLERLATGSAGGVVIVEGDAGIGKSRLVADTVERAVARGVRTMVTSGDAIERSAPYHVWRALFDNLLGLEDVAGRGEAERRVMHLLESSSRLQPFASLLNPVLRLNFRENEQSARVTPRGRSVLTQQLLVHLFRSSTRRQPVLLVLEDAHWFDSGSWALAEGIHRELPEILLLISMRPIAEEEKPAELKRLTLGEDALVVRLDALTPDESRRLACRRLRARVLSPRVDRAIREKAEGSPFFTEELVRALIDRGLVQVDHGVCDFSAAAADAPVQLPDTVQVVVSSRIDQLTVALQLTLKVASVFGRTFDLEPLRAVYPLDMDAQTLHSHLQTLLERDLVHVSDSPHSTTGYIFKHAITQEVAYSLLPYALRRQLHAAVASWYERHYPEDLVPFYPLLAHHWTLAEAAEQAIAYLDKAGEQAAGRQANEEALHFFKQAIDIDQRFEDQVIAGAPITLGRRVVSARDARRARWQRRLGDACLNLGRWDDGRRHLEHALALLGYPLPESDRQWRIGVGAQLLIQSGHRLGLRRGRPDEAAARLLREAVCAYERAGATSYFYARLDQVVYCLLRALNLSEDLVPSPEFALCCADVGNIAGLIPIHSLARVYRRLATHAASQLTDPVIAAKVLARATIHELGNGGWDACRDLEAAMASADQVGDSHIWEENATVRARAATLTAEFELAAQLGAQVRARAAANGSLVHEIWGIDVELWGMLYLGHHEKSLELADAGLHLLARATRPDRLCTLNFFGGKALAHLYRNEWHLAKQWADRIFDVMTTSPWSGYSGILGLSAAAETFVTVWEAGGPSQVSDNAARAWRLCRDINRNARINPPARARGLLWRGYAQWLEGKHRRAHATWRRCLSEADRFGLPYEVARVHYEIGRRLGVGDPARRTHLLKAQETFARVKAEPDARRATAALEMS